MTKRITVSGPTGRAGLVVAPVDFNAPPQRQPPDHEKRVQFMRGAERLLRQFATMRGPDAAKPQQTALKKLGELHNELCALEEQIAQKLRDYVAPASRQAGKALFDALGRDCFTGLDQAQAWARKNIPLSAAWAAAERDANERTKACRDHARVRGDFWEKSEDLAGKLQRHSTRVGCLDLSLAMEEVLESGRWA